MALPKEVIDKFVKVVNSLEETANILMTQVDPDALASAFTMAAIIKSLRKDEISVKVFYAGAISHAQNLTLCGQFSLHDLMQKASTMTPADFKNLILVDSSVKVDARFNGGMELDPVIVVDHHIGGDFVDTENKFILIDRIGAASTLVFELLEGVGLELSNFDKMIPLLLAVGIYTDTLELRASTERDSSAYHRVNFVTNRKELMQLFNFPLPESYFVNLKNAFENIKLHGGSLVSHIGSIHSKQGDDISTAADMFIRRNGVSLVIVWAIISDKKEVRISARSTDISLNLSHFLQERLSPNCGSKLTPDNKSSGGGVMNLDIGFWFNAHTAVEVTAVVEKFISTAIFR